MSVFAMTKLRRRQFLAAATVAAIPSIGTTTAADPVLHATQRWFCARVATDALTFRWQKLETELFKRCRHLGLTRALRSGLPEARALRVLTRKLNAAERKLERSAARIAQMRATSGEGALAKIEMGLKIQCPQDCEEMAWVLIRSGVDELREVLTRG